MHVEPSFRPVIDRIESRALASLRPSARNPRTHDDAQVRKIAASIRAFGFNSPLLISSDGEIIAGHGRAQAAKSLNMVDVPVVVLEHLSETERLAYMIADNRMAVSSRWDEGLLGDLLVDLRDDGVDLFAVGFDEEDMSRVLDDLAERNLRSIADGTADEVGDAAISEERRAKGYVSFSVILQEEQRKSVYSAIRKAKLASGTDHSGEALFIIAEAYNESGS